MDVAVKIALAAANRMSVEILQRVPEPIITDYHAFHMSCWGVKHSICSANIDITKLKGVLSAAGVNNNDRSDAHITWSSTYKYYR